MDKPQWIKFLIPNNTASLRYSFHLRYLWALTNAFPFNWKALLPCLCLDNSYLLLKTQLKYYPSVKHYWHPAPGPG